MSSESIEKATSQDLQIGFKPFFGDHIYSLVLGDLGEMG